MENNKGATITTYNNAVQVRMHNKRISLIHLKDKDVYRVRIESYDKEGKQCATIHSMPRNHLNINAIGLKSDTMEAVCIAYIKLREIEGNPIFDGKIVFES